MLYGASPAAGPTSSEAPHGAAWPRWARMVVSLLLTWHLLAMAIAPLAFPPPSSELARSAAYLAWPYLKAFSLDNGYRFFAPDPGPSHRVRYELIGPDGSVTQHHFPDRQVHWPRLLYHRFFMLAETVYAQVGPTEDVPEIDKLSSEERTQLEEERRKARILTGAIARNLLRAHPEAVSVRLFLEERAIPRPFDLDRGVRLDDDRWVRELPLGEFKRNAS